MTTLRFSTVNQLITINSFTQIALALTGKMSSEPIDSHNKNTQNNSNQDSSTAKMSMSGFLLSAEARRNGFILNPFYGGSDGPLTDQLDLIELMQMQEDDDIDGQQQQQPQHSKTTTSIDVQHPQHPSGNGQLMENISNVSRSKSSPLTDNNLTKPMPRSSSVGPPAKQQILRTASDRKRKLDMNVMASKSSVTTTNTTASSSSSSFSSTVTGSSSHLNPYDFKDDSNGAEFPEDFWNGSDFYPTRITRFKQRQLSLELKRNFSNNFGNNENHPSFNIPAAAATTTVNNTGIVNSAAANGVEGRRSTSKRPRISSKQPTVYVSVKKGKDLRSVSPQRFSTPLTKKKPVCITNPVASPLNDIDDLLQVCNQSSIAQLISHMCNIRSDRRPLIEFVNKPLTLLSALKATTVVKSSAVFRKSLETF